MADPLYDYLSKLRVSDDIKADLWDAYSGAKDEGDLVRRLTPIGVPDAIKADLFDLRRPTAQAPAGQAGPRGSAQTLLDRSTAAPAAGQPAERSSWDDFWQRGYDAFVGLGKSVADTAIGVGDYLYGATNPNMIPSVVMGQGPLRGRPQIAAMAEPSNEAQAKGKLAGDILQVAAPGNLLTQTNRAIASSLPRGLQTAARVGLEGLTGAGMASLQGEDPVRAGVISAAVPAAGAVVKAGRSILPRGRVQAKAEDLLESGARTLLPPPQKVTAQIEDALALADREGIPVDMATRSGSPMTRVIQEQVENSLGGAGTAERFRTAQSEALGSAAGRMAERARAGAPVSQEAAGAGLRGALKGEISREHGAASKAYDELRAMEQADPVKFAVDMDEVKKILKPLYEQLENAREATGQLLGGRARAAEVIRGLMKAPNTMPLSAVDEALGGVKEMARGAAMSELKSGSQTIAAQAVQALESVVRKTASQADPKVMQLLDAGRAATTQKWQIADVLESLADEPVQAFKQATFRGDAGIERLRNVAKYAPGEMPKVGRAFLDDLFGTATAEGGFSNAKTILTSWRNLGPETKKLLFPDAGLRKDLDAFFLLAKETSERPNTSGTARAMNAFNIATVPLTFPLSQVMFSERGRRALLSGMAAGKRGAQVAQDVARVMGVEGGR